MILFLRRPPASRARSGCASPVSTIRRQLEPMGRVFSIAKPRLGVGAIQLRLTASATRSPRATPSDDGQGTITKRVFLEAVVESIHSAD